MSLLNITVGLINILVATLVPRTYLPNFARVVLLAAGITGVGVGAFVLQELGR